MVPIINENLEYFMTKVQTDPSSKGAVIRLKTMMLYYNQKASEEFRRTICKEAFASVSMVIYSQKNFVLLDEFNEKIELFKSAGLIDFWCSQQIDRILMKVEVSNQPKVLTFEHVKGCFWILMMGSLISFVVFLVELLSRFCNR